MKIETNGFLNLKKDNIYAVNKVKMIQTMYFYYAPNQPNWDSEKGLTHE